MYGDVTLYDDVTLGREHGLGQHLRGRHDDGHRHHLAHRCRPRVEQDRYVFSKELSVGIERLTLSSKCPRGPYLVNAPGDLIW
jgi:hypothetical protein